MQKGTSAKTQSDYNKILDEAIERDFTIEEGERFLESEGSELEAIRKAADEIRYRTVGDVVTYVVNRNINFTNICGCGCEFCAFSCSPNDSEGYLLSLNQIADKVKEAEENGATEICLQGGLNPSLQLEDYISYIRAIREVSEDIHIHAYSPAEIDHIAQKEDLEVEKIIEKLKSEGVDSIPGTAAEILADRVREIICPNKPSVERWEEIIRTCHKLEIPTSATIMYGHVETSREISSHLVKIREIQKDTGGFTELVLLPFKSENTELGRRNLSRNLSLKDHLKIHAVARLMVSGHIDNIQTSWVKLDPKGAQKMLEAGVNDFSGTLMEENITQAAGGDIEKLNPSKIRELIREAGRIPRQRTTTYDLVS